MATQIAEPPEPVACCSTCSLWRIHLEDPEIGCCVRPGTTMLGKPIHHRDDEGCDWWLPVRGDQA
jgi:hypothetical protein